MARLQLTAFPGCKARIRHLILPALLARADGVEEFRDVFAGAGGIALAMMWERPDFSHVVNDADPTIAAMWLAVRDHPEGLIERIKGFDPSYEGFEQCKRALAGVTELPDEPAEILEIGFRRIAFQCLAHCAFMNAGRNYEIDVKWRQTRRRVVVQIANGRMQLPAKLTISNRDFFPIIADETRHALLFCDPPYVLNNLKWRNHYYDFEFTDADHRRLAEILRQTPHRWVLTYGDHPLVRELYGWATVTPIAKASVLITRPT
jgi:DNA adenine methylase